MDVSQGAVMDRGDIPDIIAAVISEYLRLLLKAPGNRDAGSELADRTVEVESRCGAVV